MSDIATYRPKIVRGNHISFSKSYLREGEPIEDMKSKVERLENKLTEALYKIRDLNAAVAALSKEVERMHRIDY